MGRFKKGLVLGGLLGAGLMWLNSTKKGKETRDRVLDAAADVYAQVKKEVLASGQWQKITESKYAALVEKAVEKYAKQNKLAAYLKDMITEMVKAQWKGLKTDVAKKKKK